MPKAKLPTPKKGIIYNSVETELGWIAFAVSHKGLLKTKFMFENKQMSYESILSELPDITFDKNDILSKWKKFFIKYFKGQVKEVSCVPIDNKNWSTFQKKVYSKTIKVPFGKKFTYGHIAVLINNPKASRAIGLAMKNNPVAPIVPCHRVVGANNVHCGFSANGGIDLKLKMLEIERKNL
ncbi:MAG: methylated-DNA--[protein]-cysteine S-methyltransferase [Candidatus Delongbacteria bacterium]|jgi:methylated-DNA-[protein]-cysteine S-methyltransferase|nr:methylated-DNA--[protein]-cysteine S-methyltransferase [Candidatus Delongbacteria bacterium]